MCQLDETFHIVVLRKLVLPWLGLVKVPGHVSAETHTAPSWQQLNRLDALHELPSCLQNGKPAEGSGLSPRQPLGKSSRLELSQQLPEGI